MAPKRNTAPTMKDVAAEAGVALGTVSKVYNNLPVRDEYREKVLAAAHKLGYSVNRYARGFKTNRTNTVALIWPTLRNPFFAYLSDAMIGELTRRDYRAIVSITNYDGQAEQRCLDMVRQNKVDGVIALTYNPDLEVAPDLPFVSIDRHFRAGVPCVASDNFGGGQLAAQKLLELGCQKLLFLREIEKRLRVRGVLVPTHVQMIGFDGIYRFDSEDLSCSTIVQPIPLLAETCVDILLKEDKSDLPSLICLPVSYAPGGTTRDGA